MILRQEITKSLRLVFLVVFSEVLRPLEPAAVPEHGAERGDVLDDAAQADLPLDEGVTQVEVADSDAPFGRGGSSERIFSMLKCTSWIVESKGAMRMRLTSKISGQNSGRNWGQFSGHVFPC